MEQRFGVSWEILSNRSTSISMLASLPMAGICRTVFVEPPMAISTLMAFSKAFLVKISRGLTSSLTSSTILLPESYACFFLSGSMAKVVAHFVNDMPSTSVTTAMVLAV